MQFGAMEFTGKLTEEDISEVQKLGRSKMYWPKVLARNWYATALVLLVIWGTIAGVVGHNKVNWHAIGMVWLILAGLFVWTFYRVKRSRARALARLDATLPNQVILTDDGVKMDGTNGATSFLPWDTFNGFREGQRVFLLNRAKVNSAVVLPTLRLSENERRSLRDFLRSRIRSVSR